MKSYLNKIKIFFVTTVILLVGFMAFGIYTVESSSFFSRANLWRLVRISGYGLVPRTYSDESINAHNSTASEVPVLLYHGIVKQTDRFNLTSAKFKEHMLALKKAGYSTITTNDLYQFEKGEKELPEKSFLLTFDDGRADSYFGADPILKELGFTAVMFISTEDSLKNTEKKSKYYLDEPELKRMVSSGRWEIGSHAIQATGGFIQTDPTGDNSNFLSNKMWLLNEQRLETEDEYKNRIDHELADSKKEIEEKLGVKIIAFSYPFGDYGQQTENNPQATSVINKLVRANYNLAFKQVWPTDNEFSSNYKYQDTVFLRRIESNTSWSGSELLSYINRAKHKLFPFNDSMSGDSGWKRTWGVVRHEGNKLQLKSSTTTTGAFVFLDGTRAWENYMYDISLNWTRGSHISLIARFLDDNNYIACSYSKDSVRIEEKVKGEIRLLAEEKNSIDFPVTNLSLGVLVDGAFTKCYIGQRTLVYTNKINPDLSRGGVAIKVWDKEIDNAAIDVTKVDVVDVESAPDFKIGLPKYKLR